MQTDRCEAIHQLLSEPDPPDLPARGHRWTQQGAPERFELLTWLPSVHTQLLLQDRDNERDLELDQASR